MNPIRDVNIASPAFKVDPYPFYARLRAEAPVCPVTLPDKRVAWLITRYDDVQMALKDERFAKDPANAQTPEQLRKQPWMPGMFRPLMQNMLDLDAPRHTRLRGLVHKAFTPRLIEEMREGVQTLANRLLDEVERQGRMDLIHDYALPIPTAIIAEMLGVPEADQRRFVGWSNAIMASTASRWWMLKALPSSMAFMRYIRKLIKQRQTNPQDDLLSALVQAKEADDQLSDDELMAMVILLLIAGHETTVNLIGTGTLALLEHPDQMEKLRADPSLIRSAVEELLRYGSPVETATERYAREDVTIAGTTIPRGGLVLAALASANRDERQFPNPDALDIARAPNRHLAFGQGIHYCVGAPLARLEGQIAINTLLRRLPDLQLSVAPAALQWRGGLIMRGLKALPVTFTPQQEAVAAQPVSV